MSLLKMYALINKWERDGVFVKLDALVSDLPAIKQRMEDMEELLKELEQLPTIRSDIKKIKMMLEAKNGQN